MVFTNTHCSGVNKIVARVLQDDTNSMRKFVDTLSETSVGSGIYNLVPSQRIIATAYRFEIDVYYNQPEVAEGYMVTVPGGPYTLVVGCV